MATHAGRTALTLPWPDPPSTVRYPPPNVLLIEGHADTRELYELWLTQRAFYGRSAAEGLGCDADDHACEPPGAAPVAGGSDRAPPAQLGAEGRAPVPGATPLATRP